MNTTASLSALRLSVRQIAAAIGLFIIITVPITIGYFSYSNLRDTLQFRSDLAAERVAQYAYVQGETWKFSANRIAELVKFTLPKSAEQSALYVTDVTGATVVRLGVSASFHILQTQSPIVVRGKKLGTVAIHVSLIPIVSFIVMVLFLSLIPAALAYWTAVLVPQRALTAAMDDHTQVQKAVDEATVELQVKAEELKQALSKEKELNDLQRQFVSMASHEFRTPMAIIDGTAQRLIRKANKNLSTTEDTIERASKIRNSVGRMVRLMESTLSAASMKEGKVKINIGACNIGEIVSEVCARQQEITEKHTISCEIIDLPEIIDGDSGALEQVFTNLLSNAVKFAPDNPNIKVRACQEDDQIVVWVRDYGIGIDNDELDSIGERFFRAKTSVGIAGTGIGLNLIKQLLEMHQGSLNVESKRGSGSTFTVRLPIVSPNQIERRA